MSAVVRSRRVLGLVACLAASFAIQLLAGSRAEAARHALIIGVGDYEQKTSGLTPLNAPALDAQSMADSLRARTIGFEVDVLTDEQIKDKVAFAAALEKFLSRVKAGDEVVFYFSGHGVNLGDKGNHYLLLDAKDQDAFIKAERKKPGTARDLDTQEKENQRYSQYLTEVAISEIDVEKAIRNSGANVIIIIADACRTQVSGTKGLVPVNGLRLPSEPAKGTFRLYAARRGQASFDSPENKLDQTSKRASQRAKKDRTPVNSLFTSVLLSQISVPRQEINVLFSRVKIEVRDRAHSLYAKEQVPDFDDSLTTRFYFWKSDVAGDIPARCRTADTELDHLRRGVAAGSIFADEIEKKRNDLAPCSTDAKNYVDEINSILRLHEQGGGGALTGSGQAAPIEISIDPNDPLQQCDALSSSPLDQNRPQGVRGVDLQSIAMDGRASAERRLPAVDAIGRAITACEAAVAQRGRVARYKFNLASAHYAMAMLADGVANKAPSLAQASKHFDDAVDLGYAAAYNGLALLHQHGEYYQTIDGREVPQPRNRAKARDNFQRGADLGHVLALYNLGMAYRTGGLGLNDDIEKSGVYVEEPGAGKAFQLLGKAAETGFIPAMIETALALKGGRGRGSWGAKLTKNPRRAIELLEIAASRGSWEAMHQLGVIYDEVEGVRDPNDAIIWYARAAEAGDSRSQARLAQMLTIGDGLPAQQPDAAGRYWRLAADGGSMFAQMELAHLLSLGKVPFRPKLQGRPDSGAEEIRDLYLSAFAKGNTWAGLRLGTLYRTGFPKDRPSDTIPKSGDTAAALLWETMDKVRQASQTTWYANPMIEVYAAFELIGMVDANEAKRRDGTDAISEDQIDQLRTDYGDPSTIKYMSLDQARRLAKVDVIWCKPGAARHEVAAWDWKRSISPVDPQLEWFERYYECYEDNSKDSRKKEAKGKDGKDTQPEVRGLKRIREYFNKQYEAWTKERAEAERKAKASNDKSKERPKAFTDRIDQRLAELDEGRGKRR